MKIKRKIKVYCMWIFNLQRDFSVYEICIFNIIQLTPGSSLDKMIAFIVLICFIQSLQIKDAIFDVKIMKKKLKNGLEQAGAKLSQSWNCELIKTHLNRVKICLSKHPVCF